MLQSLISLTAEAVAEAVVGASDFENWHDLRLILVQSGTNLTD